MIYGQLRQHDVFGIGTFNVLDGETIFCVPGRGFTQPSTVWPQQAGQGALNRAPGAQY
jgi:hypothetical protein